MYATSLTPDLGLLDAIAEVAPRVPDVMANYVSTVVRPAIENEVQRTIALYPGPVVHPFEFATRKSQAWYFANRVPKGSTGGSYQRTDELKKSWIVRIDRRSREDVLRVLNTADYAGYVYGPGNALASFRQVPGHTVTGWGAGMPQQLDALTAFAMGQLLDAWNVVVEAVLSGKDKV